MTGLQAAPHVLRIVVAHYRLNARPWRNDAWPGRPGLSAVVRLNGHGPGGEADAERVGAALLAGRDSLPGRIPDFVVLNGDGTAAPDLDEPGVLCLGLSTTPEMPEADAAFLWRWLIEAALQAVIGGDAVHVECDPTDRVAVEVSTRWAKRERGVH